MNDIKDLGNMQPDQPVKVVKANGDTVEGIYRGISTGPTEEYEAAFAPIAHSLEGGLFPPNLGEPVKIVTDQDGVSTVVGGEFAGFDATCIYLNTQDGSYSKQVALGTVLTIVDTLRRVVGGEAVRAIVRERKVPYIPKMVILKGDSTLRIPIEDIRAIKTPGHSYEKWIGLGVGAALDATVIIVLKNSFRLGIRLGGWN